MDAEEEVEQVDCAKHAQIYQRNRRRTGCERHKQASSSPSSSLFDNTWGVVDGSAGSQPAVMDH